MRSTHALSSRAPLLAAALLLPCCRASADPVPVKHPQATVHGYLALSTLSGKILAMGEEIQTVDGDRLKTDVAFHFIDGSLDQETTVFTQNPDFRLISNHHIQHGPSFPKPLDQTVNAATGEVVTKTTDKGKEKSETDHLDLAPDVANGLALSLLLNISPQTPMTKVTMVAGAPKPRIVALDIAPDGEQAFDLGFLRRKAEIYVVKIELGGVAGVVAPIIGKAPKDIRVWVALGEEPAFLKEEGQFYQDGPVWRVELAAPSYPEDHAARAKH